MYPWDAITSHKRYLESLKSNRIKSMQLNQTLKQKYKSKLQFKCIADDIWLYCNYLYDNIDQVRRESGVWYYQYDSKYVPIPEEDKTKFYEKLQEMYQNHIRGGHTFFQGKKPSAIAGALFYLACTTSGISHVGQKSIGEFICVSEPGLRSATKLLKKHLDI